MSWKIWYDDSTTFSSDDGSPHEAPVDGIVCISERFANGRLEVHHGHDYYRWMGDCWAMGNQASLERWLRKTDTLIKFGRYTAQAVYKKALEDASGGRVCI